MPKSQEPRAWPRDFVWGVSTSSFQIEGAAREDGRGPSIWDVRCTIPDKVANGDTGDIACDHYHRYAEDVAIMRTLGVDAYRFSISWPRVLPLGRGKVNEAGLAFYDRLVDTLLEADIEPWACLYHWDMPQALGKLNGEFTNEQAELLAKRMAKDAGGDVSQQVDHGIRLTTGRVPPAAEVEKDVTFIAKLKEKHKLTDAKAMQQYALLLLNANEFVYVD